MANIRLPWIFALRTFAVKFPTVAFPETIFDAEIVSKFMTVSKLMPPAILPKIASAVKLPCTRADPFNVGAVSKTTFPVPVLPADD